MEQGKPGRKEGTEEETKREQEGAGKSSEPEEVMEEDDVTEEPEMDVAVIVAELVVEAHRRKLASRVQSKEAIAEKAKDVADDDETKEELLQDSEKCEEEALATLVETEAVIENQVRTLCGTLWVPSPPLAGSDWWRATVFPSSFAAPPFSPILLPCHPLLLHLQSFSLPYQISSIASAH